MRAEDRPSPDLPEEVIAFVDLVEATAAGDTPRQDRCRRRLEQRGWTAWPCRPRTGGDLVVALFAQFVRAHRARQLYRRDRYRKELKLLGWDVAPLTANGEGDRRED
jgi:hypothetical protein